jgi:probable phosphoglycerate mutase
MRHGTCEDGLCRPGAHARPDSPLTIAGGLEAELTAGYLRERDWQPTVIVSSPLRRARQTAEITARLLGAYLAPPVAAFAEWRAPYCVLGRTPAQYPPEYLAWREQRARQSGTALPGGESLGAFAERAIEATTLAHDLATEHGTVLIVSHRLLIGAIAAVHHGQRQPATIFSHASDVRIAPAHLWTPPYGETGDQQPSPRSANVAT